MSFSTIILTRENKIRLNRDLEDTEDEVYRVNLKHPYKKYCCSFRFFCLCVFFSSILRLIYFIPFSLSTILHNPPVFQFYLSCFCFTAIEIVFSTILSTFHCLFVMSSWFVCRLLFGFPNQIQ